LLLCCEEKVEETPFNKMDLAVRASIFKWFTNRVKQVDIKTEEKVTSAWTWSVPAQEKRTSNRLNKRKK
jgi:hypothetical protein